MANLDVANTILQQLGGGRFRVMTGAKHFIGDATSLTFQIPRSNGINAVEIKLDPSDTYRVRFFKVGNKRTAYRHTDVSVHEGVYADQLQSLFTAATGLYTHF